MTVKVLRVASGQSVTVQLKEEKSIYIADYISKYVKKNNNTFYV